MCDNTILKLNSYIEDSIVDGPGLRTAIYTQGCTHNCVGCHNPQTHDLEAGKDYTTDEILDIIFSNPLCSGVTISGGEPLLQPCPLSIIAKESRKKGLNIWLYTGFEWEKLLLMMKKDKCVEELIENCDVIIDGKFEIEKRDLTLYFRGSTNQRVIDVQKSLSEKALVIYEPKQFIEG